MPDVDSTNPSPEIGRTATGGGSLAGSVIAKKKRWRPGQVAVRVIFLPFVQVWLDADVAAHHGLGSQEPELLTDVLRAMETQHKKDLATHDGEPLQTENQNEKPTMKTHLMNEADAEGADNGGNGNGAIDNTDPRTPAEQQGLNQAAAPAEAPVTEDAPAAAAATAEA
jgi:hypothetical protein